MCRGLGRTLEVETAWTLIIDSGPEIMEPFYLPSILFTARDLVLGQEALVSHTVRLAKEQEEHLKPRARPPHIPIYPPGDET